jgi:putative PIN family toxin of toxin-antitoxin system
VNRVVVDPGVFISSLIGARGSAPDLVMRAVLDDRIAAVACPLLLEELERVLRRPKFDGYADDRTRREFMERVRRHVIVADDPPITGGATRDRDDHYLVALGIAEGVDSIVSGDRDLLDAGLQTPPVMTPRELADRLAGG